MEKYINKSYILKQENNFQEDSADFFTLKFDFENWIFAIFERPEGFWKKLSSKNYLNTSYLYFELGRAGHHNC